MRVVYRKHPDTPHWEHDPMVALGEDEWGLWLGATPETIFHNNADKRFAARRPMVQLVAPGAWWTLIRVPDGKHPWYVDVIVPPVIDGDTITMVDLDLDVIRSADGNVFVDDEDEFDEHRVSLAYPERWVDLARTTAARVALDLGRLAEPFGAVTDSWVERSRAAWPR